MKRNSTHARLTNYLRVGFGLLLLVMAFVI
jgi:hypothetical protein